jgi:tRNA dimethylallyltransferase
MKHSKKLIIIYGPTGVGKTDLSFSINNLTSIEIINGDVGQLYQPIAIGTAKPDWKNEAIPHHLFDYCTEPKDITVVEYRALILQKVEEIWERGATPVIVGGSGFYIKSLFFPPKQQSVSLPDVSMEEHGDGKSTEELWDILYQHDPERAQSLIVQDRYRIMRALDLVGKGVKPSTLAPEYVPFPADVLLVFLSREREELYTRINQRVELMMQQGWIDEVRTLMGTNWESFLLRKKLIGYNDIIDYLASNDKNSELYDALIATIQKKTRNYAKRQCTFWRMLKKLLDNNFKDGSLAQEIDLNHTSSIVTSSIVQFLKGTV